MELDINHVQELFSLFSDLEGEAAEAWNPLCSSSVQRLSLCLREGVALKDTDIEELSIAAAGIAFSDYIELQPAENVRIGDISLRTTGRQSEDAVELRQHFEASVAHLLRPDCPALISTGTTL